MDVSQLFCANDVVMILFEDSRGGVKYGTRSDWPCEIPELSGGTVSIRAAIVSQL